MKTLLTMLVWGAVATAAQETPVGTIEGTVVRQGTTDPIPDVQITVGTGSGPALGQRQAQAVLDAVSGGTAGVPEELLEAAQNALRGGARGSVASASLTAVSDSAGHFVFRNVPIGNRVVRAQLQGYFGAPINGNYPATVTSNVTVTTQQTTQVRFTLVPGGTISGRVLDPAGKPLADSPVQALRSLYQNGVRTLGIVDLKPTDDRGEYRIARLPPGEYYVSASPRRTPNGPVAAPNSSEVIVVTLYPNATDVASARPIVLREGDDQSGMNIQIRTAGGAKVSGKVISSLPPAAGQRGQARPAVANLTLVPRNPTAVPDLLGGLVVSSNATDGTFEFSNVPSGSYELFARFPIAFLGGWGPGNTPALATGPWTFARTSVEVRGLNVNDLAVVIRSGVDVTGHLVVDGKPAQANVRIGLVMDDSALRVTADPPTANTFSQIMTYQPPIGADGAFTIPLVPEGKYRFQVAVGGVVPTPAATTPAPPPSPSLPATAYVADIRQSSVSIYDNGFSVGSEAANPIQILVNTNGGSLEGTVAGSDRKPVPAATVVVVPATNRRQNPALYRNVRSDPQGHFIFTAVPPGQYKVFAWENVPIGAWQNAEFLARYEQRGVSVTVNPGTRATAETGLIRD